AGHGRLGTCRGRHPRGTHRPHVDQIQRPTLVHVSGPLRTTRQVRELPADRAADLRSSAGQVARCRRRFAGSPLCSRALPDGLWLTRLTAVVAHGGDTHPRPVGRGDSQSEAQGRSERDRSQRRPTRTSPQVLDANLRPSTEHLCPPRTTVERRPRGVPTDPDLDHGFMASRVRVPPGEIETTPLSGARVATIRPRLCVAPQQLGTAASRTHVRAPANEPRRYGHAPGVGRRSVLESTPRLTSTEPNELEPDTREFALVPRTLNIFWEP